MAKMIATVQERVEAALTLFRLENPGAEISVSKLAKLAEVSRANLYTSHREFVHSLKRDTPHEKIDRKPSSLEQKLQKASTALRVEQTKNKALLYLACELRAEVHRLQARLTKTDSKGRGSVAKRKA